MEERLAAELGADKKNDHRAEADEPEAEADEATDEAEEKPGETEEKPGEKSGSDRTTAYSDASAITALYAENPKMEGSDSHRRHAPLRSDMTAAVYPKAAAALARRPVPAL